MEIAEINSIDIKENYIKQLDAALLGVLLKDKSSGQNLLWATDTYVSRGFGFAPQDEIMVQAITGRRGTVIKPRITKSKKEQKERIKKKGEVFTPSWICNEMASGFDEWFGRQNVFNTPDGVTWHKTEDKITFPEGKTWQQYIRLRILEITCGEAPFLASRYDTVTGEWIDVNSRVGLLDRKLRVINENIDSEDDWVKYTFEAYQSTYGFEWQGDSLLIARENLLFTFIDYFLDKFGNFPKKEYLLTLANILAWNIFQMDGLKYVIPYSCKPTKNGQISLFDVEEEFPCPGCESGDCSKHTGIYPVVKNWRTKVNYRFYDLLGGNKMKFDFVIGNPPYQEETESESTRMPPVYDYFMDGAYQVSDKVELITPARFLFDAGYTPKAWNLKMLNDKHFKVVYYEAKSSAVFPNTDIKGGVAITYRDTTKDFGAIGTFTVFPELNGILHKVLKKAEKFLDTICYPALSYKLTPLVIQDFPDCVGRLRTSAFTKLSEIFYDKKPNDGHEYIEMIGLLNTKRTSKFVRRDYIKTPDNFESYKIILPASNGSGALGEVLSTPLIGQPLIGHTQTFISIGCFTNEQEANACFKYVKSKFARVMLGILKITQHNPPEKWRYVPLQDFTSSSDIDWSQSVAEIDVQLYRKYGLDDKEISFIETHVKEMD